MEKKEERRRENNAQTHTVNNVTSSSSATTKVKPAEQTFLKRDEKKSWKMKIKLSRTRIVPR